MSRTIVFAALLLAACGGKELAGADADLPDAPYYDLDAHWGECCFTYEGGTTGACPPNPAGWHQCDSTQYCGFQYAEFTALPGSAPTFACCGFRFPDASLTENEQIDRACPPFPAAAGSAADLPDAGAALAPHWGECCYLDHGGVPGTCAGKDIYEKCANDAGYCFQCAPYQYCGFAVPNAAPNAPPPSYTCCGDRYLAGAGYSPVDPSCLPAAWDGGS